MFVLVTLGFRITVLAQSSAKTTCSAIHSSALMTSAADRFSGASKKRQRKSRFSSRSAAESSPSTNDVLPKSLPSVPHISASVSSLRTHLNEQKNLLSSRNASTALSDKTASLEEPASPQAPGFQNPRVATNKPISDAPPAKRQRTGRSRFAQAAPVNAPQSHMGPIKNKTQPDIGSSIPQSQSFQSHVSPSIGSTDFIDITAIPIAPVKTININRKADKKQKLAAVLKVSKSDLLETDPLKNPHFDPMLPQPVRPPRPIRKQVNFVPEGAISTRAEKERQRATIQVKRNNYISQLTNRAVASSDLPVLPPLAEDLKLRTEHEVPKAEWWDLPFLAHPDSFLGGEDMQNGDEGVLSPTGMSKSENNVDDNSDIELREERITHYIHHPSKINPAKPPKEPPAIPLMLTKKETKKLRRQRRKEANQEKQEMIATGLVPPPPPKVKLSNMMRVLSNEASADPTKVESEVRAQIEARRQKHEADNEARKKSGEEKREKGREKREKDRQAGLLATVYRVLDVTNATNRFKVIRNARQLELTGVLLKFDGCNVVVVEGGAKVLRKYKKLMLRRINWQGTGSESKINNVDESIISKQGTEADERDAYNEGVNQSNGNLQTDGCVLVWEGVISSASFEGFRFMEMRGESACRKMFREHHVEHYWDLCLQGS